MSNTENETKWKISSQTLPIAYVILVCIGYTEKSIFYDKFGIDIAPYLNFEEYLFIFLPIGSALVIAFLFFSTFIAGIIGANYTLFGSLKNVLENPQVSKDKKKSKQSKFLSKTKRIRTILSVILILILVLAPLSILLFFGLTKNFYEREFTIIIFLWGFIMLTLYMYQSFKNENSKSLLLLYAFFMAFLIPILWSQETEKADKILSGKSEIKVSFLNNNHSVKTNDTLAFIGQTKEYLFLRDLNSNGNLIYKKDKISEMQIIK